MARLATNIVTAALVLFALVSADSQHFAPRHRGGRVFREAAAADEAHHRALGFTPNSTASYVAMPVDHQKPSLGTFPDKFYFDTTFWDQANGPCMFYLNGEGPLDRAVSGYMADIARNMSACTVAIEHRWYGESLPAPLTDKALLTSTLTVDQAMQDVAFLMAHFESNIAKRPLNWMLVGGSYSGGMTVWLNEKYPGKFKASWAASGVVRSTFSYVDYDGHVKKVTSRDCGDALRFIVEIAGAWFDDATLRPELQAMFNLDASQSRTDVMWAFADAGASSVQYGMKTQMCNMLLPVEFAKPREALQKFAKMSSDLWGPNFMNSCYYNSKCLSNTADSAKWGPAGYSWIWECCNEMAWWQIGYPGSIRSENITTSYFIEQCRGAFYNTTAPDAWAFNTRHHGLHPVTDGYIVATQGSDDPWSTTGLSVNQGPNFPVNTAQCTNCGHCGAMMAPAASDPVPLQDQRKLVLESLNRWMAR